MRKLFLVILACGFQVALADECLDVHKSLKIGGSVLNLSTLRSTELKVLFQKILSSKEIRPEEIICSGNAVRTGYDLDIGAILLISGDKISSRLWDDYAIGGDLIFTPEFSRPFPADQQQFGGIPVLMLDWSQVPSRVPGKVGKDLIFDWGFKLVNDVEIGETFSVLLDAQTREAIVLYEKRLL